MCACVCVCVCVCAHAYLSWTSGIALVRVYGSLQSTCPTAWELLVLLCPSSSLQALPGLLYISSWSSETNTGCFFLGAHGPGLATQKVT